jgi:hypothetical protein
MSLHPRLPYTTGTTIPRYILRRGCALAESRLSYLAELFESGRWRRFHSEIDFLDNIQEAKEAVERWRSMLAEDASGPVVMPWQSSPPIEPVPAHQGTVLYEAPRPSPRGAAVTPADLNWQQALDPLARDPLALDPKAIGERYPMLRAAM